ncbi:NAD(P)H-quinone oxidoreductase [Alphaproteobacteria bacterium]|nr:NAD(P)H-quinone oxidoreductase [Alphaproteobacteria bacterium]MDC1023361.1 NAD(P)H-quinone oxidoreductase [Alphaproteobacteria bacterium]
MTQNEFEIPKQMRAVEILEFGGPKNLKSCIRPIPKISKNQVLIRVAFAGVNRPDLLQRQGNYKVPDTASDIPGLEVSGIIVDLNNTNSNFNIGDKVCALCHGGGYAEYVAVDIGHCMKIPKNYSMQEASCIPETFITVWSNLFIRGKLKVNDKVLIHGGASGIGTTAIQLAKSFGATVYATAGNDNKCLAAEKIGASKCINYKAIKFEDEIMQLTNGKGVDVILDMVAGNYVPRNLKCLSHDGRLVIIAVQGGIKDEVNFANIMIKRQTITGSTLRPQSSASKSEYVKSLLKGAWVWLESDKIRPIIQKEFDLSQASDAHQALEDGDHIGKFIMKVSS